MTDFDGSNKITLDGVEYLVDSLPNAARDHIESIKFSDVQILQLQNEWAISNTARTGYLNALKAELSQREEVDG